MPRASRAQRADIHIRHLAKSVLSLVSLNLCSTAAFNPGMELVLDLDACLKWASVVSFIGAVYYSQYLFWRWCLGCNPGRHTSPYTAAYRDVALQPSATSPLTTDDASSEADESAEARPVNHALQRIMLPPELSIGNVWVHVYGWGLMLFVGIYSLSGIYLPGSNWWSLGLILLSIDELIGQGIKTVYLSVLALFMAFSTVVVWWGVVGDSSIDQSFSEVLTGVFAPAMSPFMLYSIRFNVRNVSKDVPRLVEIAMPFMIIVSACVFVIRSDQPGSFTVSTRRHWAKETISVTNVTDQAAFYESYAQFQYHNYSNQTQSLGVLEYPISFINHATGGSAVTKESAAMQVAAILLAPLLSLAVLWVMISCVIDNCATEFVVALTLCSAVRFGLSREYDPISAMALTPSALSFILVILLRKREA